MRPGWERQSPYIIQTKRPRSSCVAVILHLQQAAPLGPHMRPAWGWGSLQRLQKSCLISRYPSCLTVVNQCSVQTCRASSGFERSIMCVTLWYWLVPPTSMPARLVSLSARANVSHAPGLAARHSAGRLRTVVCNVIHGLWGRLGHHSPHGWRPAGRLSVGKQEVTEHCSQVDTHPGACWR